MARPYLTKSGKRQYKPSIKEVMLMEEENEGFCVACGETQSGVESDACRYKCEACGLPKVYGAGELALMGLVY